MPPTFPAWAGTLCGAVSLSAASYAHVRYLRRPAAVWTVLRSVFADSPPIRDRDRTDITSSTRSAAFGSGLLLSGLTLSAGQFGQVGLGLGGDLHAFGEVLIAAGFLTGIGSQLARSCTLTGALQAPTTKMAVVPTATALTTAVAAAALGQHVARPFLYLDAGAALHSFDAAAVYDGPSMVAFTGAVLGFVALRSQIAAKRSVKPVGVAFASGVGVGLGVGLLNLCDADLVLSTLSGSGNAGPLLLLGLGTTAVLSQVMRRRLACEATPLSSPSSPTWTVIGSSMSGLGLGLTGLMPASALVGLSSGAASFWLFSASMLAGAGSVYAARAARAYFSAKTAEQSSSSTTAADAVN